MKIISITTVKNEADIIESFVRYHLNIFDFMIVLDNGSSDDTKPILNELIKEDLPIKVMTDRDRYFEPYEKYNHLLGLAMDEYGADIVCPLDVDEFIITKNGNPRRYIEKIPKDSYYTVGWRTYVPTQDDASDDLFIPSRITHLRDPSIEHLGKVIVTRQLVKDYNAKLIIGNHDIQIDRKSRAKVKNIRDNGLNIAHFPLRSVKQTISKILTNYPNSRARKDVNEKTSYHYDIMYNRIRRKANLDMDDVTLFASQYSLRQNRGKDEFDPDLEVVLYDEPVNIDFCTDIDIRYEYTLNPMANLLENTLYLADEIHNFKKRKPKATPKRQAPAKDDKKTAKAKKTPAPQKKDTIRKDSDSKDTLSSKFLRLSNSYTYYRKNYEMLAEDMALKDEQIRSLELKESDNLEKIISKQNQIIKEFRNSEKRNRDMGNELKYAFVFNDTIRDSEWLENKSFSLVNSAANYSLMYSLYRILEEVKPKNILELGMGQTSKLTTQYANYFSDVKLTILEGDQVWIDNFSSNLNITDNVVIKHMNLEEIRHDKSKTIRFKYMPAVVMNEKYDLIIIDGPQGFFDDDKGKRHMLRYSRTNVWQLIPDNLSEDFIILFDDYNRAGEKRTVRHLKELLDEHDIEYYDYTAQGLKHQYALLSPSYRYISWI